jgi:hypothetical protein
MGERGPIPKRSTQRRRRNKTNDPEIVQITSPKAVVAPEPDPNWHPIAASWFASLTGSGQSQFYEPSDWQTARFVAEVMSRSLRVAGKPSGYLITAVMSAMGELLCTEGARRRARIELERHAEAQEPAEVAILASYRRAAKKGAS